MRCFLLLAMLVVCASALEDLSGKMFTFPAETNSAHVKLITTKHHFSAVTVCHRSITDLKREHSLFSLATPSFDNDFLIFWQESTQNFIPFIRNKLVGFGSFVYKPITWHSICTTWDSTSGLMQMWVDGQSSIRKFISSGSNISGQTLIILGQEQDSYGGGFDSKQSFVGMMSDVHMWDYTLSPCEIQNYMNSQSFTPGNVLNWKALDYNIVGNVLVEKQSLCLNSQMTA
ncbi:C-reactive protein-like [Cololabis saira]|uniref:C-reactive protein-like n=1 Tax=Cololabis saira TaxID=129043 RepID=UPI002AD2D015|nr:C-reactive protein-like [Cololabis saira]XP_061565845.1 C-reactive protein-like [Cololabis saira]